MAAGLGFKTFTTGEVLTAADTNGYLMQGVLVFASAAARDAAITSPQEGQCCYLKDTDAVLTYSGAAWVGFDDSNAIQNTIVDAKGDLITATAADTPARLAVGTNGQTLVADSTTATGLKWAAASAGALTKISTYTFTAAAALNVNNCFSATYKRYLLLVKAKAASGANDLYLKMRVGGVDRSSGYYYSFAEGSYTGGGIANIAVNSGTGGFQMLYAETLYQAGAVFNIFNPFETTSTNIFKQSDSIGKGAANYSTSQGTGVQLANDSFDGFSLVSASGTYTGEVVVYGYSD